jgi:uncharacterized protein (DUF58 family)
MLPPPAELARLPSLELVARTVVDGLHAGLHRSPLKGSGGDFVDHRGYTPGDDLRRLDWKILARSDRLVIKRHEAETDFACVVAVDGSASMAYAGARAGLSKWNWARMVAASLVLLATRQGDRAGLTVFSEGPITEVPASGAGAVERCCRALAAHTPTPGANASTDPVGGMARLASPGAGPAAGRGVVVLITDAVDDPATTGLAIDRLRHRGHDVSLLWVLDPDEADLELAAVTRFQGLEGATELALDPRAVRRAYVEEVEKHRVALRAECLRRQVPLVECRTTDGVHVALERLLAVRRA